jgi:hypothetical protein
MYHTVGRVGEIAEGTGIPVELEGRVIAVFQEGVTTPSITAVPIVERRCAIESSLIGR